jgi:hypothetical protein
MTIQTFNADNSLATVTNQVWSGGAWNNSTKWLYSYNSDGSLARKNYQTWSGGWVNQSVDVYTYVGGLLSVDQYQTWNAGTASFNLQSQKQYWYFTGTTKLQFEFDQNFTAGALVNTNKYEYTYDATYTNMTSKIVSSYNGTGYTNLNKTNYSYDSLGNMTTKLYSTWNTTTSTWVNSTLDNYAGFSAAHNPSSDVNQTWDTAGSGFWVNKTYFTYSYNGSNQMTNMVGESWNIAGFWEFALNDPAANYYYQPYSLGVENVAENGTVDLFPVPASSVLNINLSLNEAQSGVIAIYDMQGRLVNQISFPTTTKFNSSISLTGVASGNYIVSIRGEKSQIVRQIVVAH